MQFTLNPFRATHACQGQDGDASAPAGALNVYPNLNSAVAPAVFVASSLKPKDQTGPAAPEIASLIKTFKRSFTQSDEAEPWRLTCDRRGS